MASKRNALSFLIDHGVDPDLLIGFHFHPTYEEGIRIVNIKNAECYCFTKLEPLGKIKANRILGDVSRGYYWKNIKPESVRDDDNNVIGWVTKLVLHRDKNTPTEWHILEYRDRKTADAGRWVLCQIYKREKNNDSASPIFFDPCIDNATLPHVESDVEAGQFSSSTSQVSSMWAIGASGDMNQGQHDEMSQCSYTQPACFSNAETNPDLTGGHMNQDQIHGVGQSWYTPQDGMVYNSQQLPSSPNSIVDFDMGFVDDEFINQDGPKF
ncbi:hypothetical protein CKAN_00163200 [Cinnamomum micranthum f. kanehirae]|uniref:NAC domain-containing protein n=1 Tax=Cinnamomum micranthum f. kanehirae TaxID=337451 RepID=A0A443N4B3_9MAGN|nr:hypothetical protein CKAN_00163200 [Cinnamomum micranthum f. kanehirae]